MLCIDGNSSLTSLTGLAGLDNLDPANLEILFIARNPVLSSCAVQSICNYIKNPNDTIMIFENAGGCDTPGEVETACDTIGINDSQNETNPMICPNPVERLLTFCIPDNTKVTAVTIYDRIGKKVVHIETSKAPVDISGFPPGLYVVEFLIEDRVIIEKIIVQ
jgi:hypothetical protein